MAAAPTHRAPRTRSRARVVATALTLPALVALAIAAGTFTTLALLPPPAPAPAGEAAARPSPVEELLLPQPDRPTDPHPAADRPRPAAPGPATGARYGVDVGWPQCGATLPKVPLDFVVVGLTNGHAASVNPCLADQVAWARARGALVSLYVVPNSPDAATADAAARAEGCPTDETDCVPYLAGVLQARHALAAARDAGVTVHTWWLDVEESIYGTLWSSDQAANAAVLRGWATTLARAGHEVGLYSTSWYWQTVTGDLETRLPEWVATGEAGIDAARDGCATPFSTGPVVLTQWLTGPIDGNLVCRQHPGLAGDLLGRWTRTRTAGVPAVLTTPVPHPHPTLEDLQGKTRHHHKHKHHGEHQGTDPKPPHPSTEPPDVPPSVPPTPHVPPTTPSPTHPSPSTPPPPPAPPTPRPTGTPSPTPPLPTPSSTSEVTDGPGSVLQGVAARG